MKTAPATSPWRPAVPGSWSRWRLGAALAMVPLAVAIVYGRVLEAYFFEDDFQWLVGAWSFRPRDLLNLDRYNHFYRPVIELYFYVTVRAFGHSAVLFHLFNVALHTINGFIVWRLVRVLTLRETSGFLSALLFVVQPGYIEAVAWVSALAEPLAAAFYCSTILAFVRCLRSGERRWLWLSLATFTLALLTHESSATLLPMLILTEWTFAKRPGVPVIARAMVYVPYGLVLATYLPVDAVVNRRNYVISGGHYQVGIHAIGATLKYIVSLYVGRKGSVTFIAIAICVVLLLIRGTPRVRYFTLWILITLAPFSFFTWGTTSRYLYLPAVGFAMLLAEGVQFLERLLTRASGPAAGRAFAALASAALAARFLWFASSAVSGFTERTEGYRRVMLAVTRDRSHIAADGVLRVREPRDRRVQPFYLESMFQWEYDDPTLRVMVERR